MPLTSTGLTVPRLADLRTTWRAAVAASATLGPAWQTGPGSILGQIGDSILVQVSDLYELLAQVYEAFDPDAAQGTQLDLLCAIVGIVREPATYSTGICQLNGAAATVVPAGTLLRVPDGPIVETDVAVTLTGAPDDVACTAVEIGAIIINITTVTEIVTPVAGLATCTNGAAFATGRELETDSELRTRREQSLVAPSASTDYGISSALAALTDVDSAWVVSDRVNHTMNALIYPNTADPDGIAVCLWNNAPAGIEMIGAESATVTDALGHAQTVKWDFVSDVACAIVVDVHGLDNTAGNTAAIRAAVAARWLSYGVGESVYSVQIVAAVVTAMGEDVETCTATVNGGASQAILIDEIADCTLPVTVNYV